MSIENQRILVFGASGYVGSFVASRFSERGWEVYSVSRSHRDRLSAGSSPCLVWDPNVSPSFDNVADELPPMNAVVWAQGQNFNDNVASVKLESHLEMYRANVAYIIETLRSLLAKDRLVKPARLCVVSSIWQNIARQNKLSYSVTKAALQGLVLSASMDLGEWGHVINAVLPGAIDTPMTRANLSPEQLLHLEHETLFHSLPNMEEVCSVIEFLCSPTNTGMTGQFIAVDKGFSRARII